MDGHRQLRWHALDRHGGWSYPYWSSWTFDQIGLRKTQVRHGLPGASGGDTTTSYAYPASGVGAVRPHALSSTSTTGPAGATTIGYGYNAVGDTTTTTRTLPAGNQTLAWTEHNRLGAVTTPAGTTSYVYDADGTQLIRRDPGSTTLYLPGEEITRDHATGTPSGRCGVDCGFPSFRKDRRLLREGERDRDDRDAGQLFHLCDH